MLIYRQLFLQTARELEKTGDKWVDHYSATRLEILANIFAVSVATGVLLVPVFLLYLIPMSRVMMALTASTFVVLFTVAVTTTTGAKVHEVFFGTAA